MLPQVGRRQQRLHWETLFQLKLSLGWWGWGWGWSSDDRCQPVPDVVPARLHRLLQSGRAKRHETTRRSEPQMGARTR